MIDVLGYMRWFREPDLRMFRWLAERSELFRESGARRACACRTASRSPFVPITTLCSLPTAWTAFQLLDDDLDVTDIAFLAKRAVGPADRP